MRADKPMDESTCVDMYRRVVNYINKLRYERLMSKALFLKELKYNGDYFYSSVGSKTWEEIEMQLSRISRVYEARAKRIKEGK